MKKKIANFKQVLIPIVQNFYCLKRETRILQSKTRKKYPGLPKYKLGFLTFHWF